MYACTGIIVFKASEEIKVEGWFRNL
jgi:hypothetical protein